MKQEQVPKPQVAGKTATATPKSQKLPARPQVLVGKRPELPSCVVSYDDFYRSQHFGTWVCAHTRTLFCTDGRISAVVIAFIEYVGYSHRDTHLADSWI